MLVFQDLHEMIKSHDIIAFTETMKAAHDAGRRVCFRRGKLIIDSRVTTIEGANGSGGSVHENVDVA